MASAKRARWRCNECGAEGEALTRNLARAEFAEHWGDWHNTVPWVDEA